MRFRLGQVLTRTKATLSGFRLVRNLPESHTKPNSQSNTSGQEKLNTASFGMCGSTRFRTSRTAQWAVRASQDLPEVETHIPNEAV